MFLDGLSFKIFKRGSKTYYYSSLLFPKEIRIDVAVLYAFVRTIDDFIDVTPQKENEFLAFKNDYLRHLEYNGSKNQIIVEFVDLMKKYRFQKEWIEQFFRSMSLDLKKGNYETIEDVEKYMYGSAEVIGLMMSEIIGLDRKADPYAMLLGKSMQYLNFIRDISEDNILRRNYFPQNDLFECGLGGLSKEEAIQKKEKFETFIKKQLSRYYFWQKEAEKGYSYIPYRSLVPIKTAADLYLFTARTIERDPLVVFERKVKPSVAKIAGKASYNLYFSK